MMKQNIIALATLGLLTVSASAVDTKACAGCHGANFEKAALGKSKIVKDMNKADIEKALKGYKDGSYGGAMKDMMKNQVVKLSNDDITAIAETIAGGSSDAKAEDNATKTDDNATKSEDNTTKTDDNATKSEDNATKAPADKK